MTRSADSVSANIAEGYGRFFYKDSQRFYYYSRGSLQETKAWINKCKRRSLVDASKCDELIEKAGLILIKLNAYIKFVSNSPVHNPEKGSKEEDNT
jgi:four helix bundle protein